MRFAQITLRTKHLFASKSSIHIFVEGNIREKKKSNTTMRIVVEICQNPENNKCRAYEKVHFLRCVLM